MANVGNAELEISHSGAGDTVGALQSVGGALSSLGKVALAVGAAGLTALAAGFGLAISEAMEAQRVMAQTNAVIASTKGVAGVSAEAVADLAQSLQNMSGVAAEAIQAGQNILLTFTNIGSSVFPAATQTMLDMSVALGQDLKSSAIQLGKALQDPIAGITALRRVGVNFTDAQQKMIGKLVESGQLLEAQKLILKELETEFGGSAAAIGKTFGGQLEIAKLRLLDIAEAAGMKLLPALSSLIDVGLPFVEKFAMAGADALVSLGDALVGLAPTAKDALKTIESAFFHLKAGWSPLMVLGNLLPGVFTPEIRSMIDSVADSLARIGEAVSPAITSFIDSLGASLNTAFSESGPTIINNITTAFEGLADFFETNGPAISNALSLIGTGLGQFLVGILTIGSGIASIVGQLLSGDFSGALATAGATLSTFADSVSQAFGGVDFSQVLATWGSNFAALGAIISGAAGNAIAAAQAWAMGVVGGMSAPLVTLVGVVSGYIGAAVNAVSGFVGGMSTVGAQLGNGLVSGAAGVVGKIVGVVVAAVEAAIAAAKAAAGVASPSKEMAYISQMMGAGFINEMGRMADPMESAMSNAMGQMLQPAYAMARMGSGTVYNQSSRTGDMHIGSMTIQAADDDTLTALLTQAQQGRAAV